MLYYELCDVKYIKLLNYEYSNYIRYIAILCSKVLVRYSEAILYHGIKL